MDAHTRPGSVDRVEWQRTTKYEMARVCFLDQPCARQFFFFSFRVIRQVCCCRGSNVGEDPVSAFAVRGQKNALEQPKKPSEPYASPPCWCR